MTHILSKEQYLLNLKIVKPVLPFCRLHQPCTTAWSVSGAQRHLQPFWLQLIPGGWSRSMPYFMLPLAATLRGWLITYFWGKRTTFSSMKWKWPTDFKGFLTVQLIIKCIWATPSPPTWEPRVLQKKRVLTTECTHICKQNLKKSISWMIILFPKSS